jgi:hypothetical protein
MRILYLVPCRLNYFLVGRGATGLIEFCIYLQKQNCIELVVTVNEDLHFFEKHDYIYIILDKHIIQGEIITVKILQSLSRDLFKKPIGDIDNHSLSQYRFINL